MRNFSNPTHSKRSLVVGLTGGIASGKSAAEKFFAELGVPIADADQVAREVVMAGSPALNEISKKFGKDYLMDDGTLNRAKMRELVFSNPDALVDLEKITHPRIREWLKQWTQKQTAPYCIISAAILLESGLNTLVDRVLVIDVSVNTQLQRLLARDNIPNELAEQMIESQWSREKRLGMGNDVIQNNGSLDDLRKQVADQHKLYSAPTSE